MTDSIFVGIDIGAEGSMAALFPDRTSWLLAAPMVVRDGRKYPNVDLMLEDAQKVVRKAKPQQMVIAAVELPVPLRNWDRGPACPACKNEIGGPKCAKCGQTIGPGPVRGTIANARLNKVAGLWGGIFTALGAQVVEVYPYTWKRAMLSGMPDYGKQSAVSLAQMMHPELRHHLKRAKDHNRAEAILIGEWARLHGRKIVVTRLSRAAENTARDNPLFLVQEEDEF